MVTVHKDSKSFKAARPWGARGLANIDGVTVKLHWTDTPYKWHKNDGHEVFVVLAGVVDMHYRQGNSEKCVRLEATDMFVADEGDEHCAYPIGEARILVIERQGSV